MFNPKEREVRLLGLRIHNLSMLELVEYIRYCIHTDNKIIVYGFSANIFSRLRRHPEFVQYFEKIDIVVADGQGIPIIAKWFNVPIKERIGIVNLSHNLLDLANRFGHRIFLLGGTDEINKRACEFILNKYPAIKKCSGRNGYFDESDESEVQKTILAYAPDILFIGISSPMKENFALKYKSVLGSAIIVPCGGWFDVLAGKVKRPPFLFKRFPVTWIFRFVQEPKRMFGPILLTVIDTVFFILPILYLKHKFGVEKNPSIVKYLKL